MTDEERFAKDLKDLALSIRVPQSVSTALDRAATRTLAHPTSRFALRSWPAVAAGGIIAAVVLVASLVVATAPAGIAYRNPRSPSRTASGTVTGLVLRTISTLLRSSAF